MTALYTMIELYNVHVPKQTTEIKPINTQK